MKRSWRRVRGWRALLICVAALSVTAVSRAEGPAEPPPAPDGILRPCNARGEQGREAKALLWKIRGAFEAGDGPETVSALIVELLDHPCLALPRKELGEAIPEDPRALVDWYRRGGRSWLDWATHTSPASMQLQLPPSFRPWLDGLTLPAAHPLKSIVCASSDVACGQDTAGWLWRQERYPRKSSNLCRQAENYRAFLHCLHQYLPTTCLYPGGRFHRPDRGVLIWSRIGGGTRSWIFDLQTGRALRYRIERMAPRNRVLIEEGPVARDNLHEAVLALLLTQHCSPGLRGSTLTVSLSDRIRHFDPAAPLPEQGGVGGLGGGGTRYVRRAWSYLPDGKKLAARLPLETPMRSFGGLKYSDLAPPVNPMDLMQVVELGFRPTRRVVLTIEQGNQVYEALETDRPRRLLELIRELAAVSDRAR